MTENSMTDTASTDTISSEITYTSSVEEQQVEVETIDTTTPKITYKETFDYIDNELTRVMVKSAYDAISRLEAWEYIRTVMETQRRLGKEASFMTLYDDTINRIYYEIDKTYGGHSGSSFAFTMRNMESIALYGEDAYRKRYHSDKKPMPAWA